MHTLSKTLIGLALSFTCVAAAQAADRMSMNSFQAALDAGKAEGKLDGSVKFYLAGTGPKGKVVKAGAVTNRKTNAFGKSDDKACEWAALSALISLQEAAKQAGANAVINIVSYYKKNENKSASQYECHAGAVVAGVALKGDLAIVK
ncbi:MULTISPECIES: excinuclease [unclassified Achromobacter]|uniref:excinuclease n=1 Tax=unclassified Achromobacter TaxID=2626865 RepID=UPI000B518CF2|nr:MULTISPECIES: excinuclease [unclassified Achromobacter]OWT76848.1 excinuclease [Achromobacter sp. HZ28]OWT77728.1 excinuclease [Achromobacter sp. HZ34]